MNELLSLLEAFGVTPQNSPYLIIVAIILGGVVYLRSALREETNRISSKLSLVRDNMLVVITHLTVTSRSKLDPSLIKAMSPLKIQPAGMSILNESGLINLLNEEPIINSFFNCIDSFKPSSRLEVENTAIFAFLKLIHEDELLKSVKTYLYENPKMSDVFPTLAGLYIRDLYLEAHKDIKD